MIVGVECLFMLARAYHPAQPQNKTQCKYKYIYIHPPTNHFKKQITAMRLEILGTGFTAQHSDARVLDQLIYKWAHSRRCVR